MSNAIKSEVKAVAAHDIGVLIDDILEDALKTLNQATGAQIALLESAKSIHKLNEAIDEDVASGALSEEAAVVVKRYVSRSASISEVLAQRSGNIVLISQGKVHALREAVTATKKYMDTERKKAFVQQDVGSEAGHPGTSIKEERNAEASEQAPAEAVSGGENS